jgi:hypothetical protein
MPIRAESTELTTADFLAQVRSRCSPTHPFRLAIESMSDRLTPDEVRRHLPLLLSLARVKEG